jgi:hypothetical protein
VEIYVTVGWDNVNGYSIWVRVAFWTAVATEGSVVFQKDYGATKPSCLELLNENIPFLSKGGTVRCDETAAVCELTAL